MLALSHAEQKARDALLFDPLPASEWVFAIAEGIIIRSPVQGRGCVYGSFVSGCRLIADSSWLLPFAAQDQIRRDWDAIHQEIARTQAWHKQKTQVVSSGRFACERIPDTELPDYRPMRPEMKVQIGAFVPFTLEQIGFNTRKMLGIPRASGVWQVEGWTGRKWHLSPVEFSRSFEKANSTGSRGVSETYRLYRGPVYMISERPTWSVSERFFGRVKDSMVLRISSEEVRECLEK